jgi:hypothetical protein
MEKRRKFIVGDLVRYEKDRTASLGIVVESLSEQRKKFVYKIRWFNPYEVFGELVYEDEVYENSLALLSRPPRV